MDKTSCKRLKTFPLPFWKRWNGCYEHINVNLTCLFLRSLRISGPAGTTVSLVGTDPYVKPLLILRPSMPSSWTEKLRQFQFSSKCAKQCDAYLLTGKKSRRWFYLFLLQLDKKETGAFLCQEWTLCSDNFRCLGLQPRDIFLLFALISLYRPSW